MKTKNGLYENIICMLVYLLIAFLGSVLFLALVALLLFKFQIAADTVSILMIAVYILMPLTAGLLMGRKMGERKFMYGAMMGAVYFLILCVFSMIYQKTGIAVSQNFFTTALLCIGGGTLGGMLG